MDKEILDLLNYYHAKHREYCDGRRCGNCKHADYTRAVNFSCFSFSLCLALLGDSMSKEDISKWLTEYRNQCEIYCEKHYDLKNKCPSCIVSELHYGSRHDCFECFIAMQLFKDV